MANIFQMQSGKYLNVCLIFLSLLETINLTRILEASQILPRTGIFCTFKPALTVMMICFSSQWKFQSQKFPFVAVMSKKIDFLHLLQGQ